MAINVTQLLEKVYTIGATDLHLTVNTTPTVRINRALSPLPDFQVMTIEDIEYFLSQVLTQEQKDLLDINKEVDFSVALGNKARFRVNAFFQKGYPAVALRLIPMQIPNLESLNLPLVIGQLCGLSQGLVLVVGPSGQGKSTAIASMIDRINETRAEHIVTIEDPIEYMFVNKKSIVEQREMFLDTHSWSVALKSVLRQDPNIVFIGEMRDFDTISSAISIAETGHLVFATLHTNSASQTIDRIIDAFPEEQQKLVRVQLSQILEAVVSTRLLPSAQKGLVPAVELLLGSEAVKNLIREGKTYQIDNVIATSVHLGMISLEHSLSELVNKGWLDAEEALRVTTKPDILRRMLTGIGSVTTKK
jgi:twitching motility protein PilT